MKGLYLRYQKPHQSPPQPTSTPRPVLTPVCMGVKVGLHRWQKGTAQFDGSGGPETRPSHPALEILVSGQSPQLPAGRGETA